MAVSACLSLGSMIIKMECRVRVMVLTPVLNGSLVRKHKIDEEYTLT